MLENQARAERYNISKALFACKLAEGSPVSPHMIKMMGYIETLTKFGCEIKDDLATNVILQSLPVSYESFIMNFYMNGIEKIMAELPGVLKIAKASIKNVTPRSEKEGMKPPYVCPGCSNHTYGQQYGEQIQYLVKLQTRIFTK
jgi:hypothetical protein